MANEITREQRQVELEKIDTVKELKIEAEKVNLVIKPGTSKADARLLILGAQFGVPGAGEAGEGTPPAPPPPDAGQTPPDKPWTPPEKEQDPLLSQQVELDTKMGELYEQLVEKIKEAAREGGTPETCEQMRAGAVQFLRQCNATLSEARALLENVRKVISQNNEQLQSIAKAKQDLEKRSDAYKRMTTGGAKNAE